MEVFLQSVSVKGLQMKWDAVVLEADTLGGDDQIFDRIIAAVIVHLASKLQI